MKLIAIEESRLTSLFHTARLQGQTFLPHIAIALVERYSFSGAPKSFEELNANNVEFLHGLFEGIAIERLQVYEDGVVVSSRSDTEILDHFLEDLIKWIGDEYEITTYPNRKINRSYESNIVVEADEKVLAPLAGLSNVSEKVSSLIKANSGLDLSYMPVGFIFAADRTRNPDLQPVPFRFERRFAAEFSFNQFVSSAPLQTNQHIEILKAIEAAF